MSNSPAVAGSYAHQTCTRAPVFSASTAANAVSTPGHSAGVRVGSDQPNSSGATTPIPINRKTHGSQSVRSVAAGGCTVEAINGSSVISARTRRICSVEKPGSAAAGKAGAAACSDGIVATRIGSSSPCTPLTSRAAGAGIGASSSSTARSSSSS